MAGPPAQLTIVESGFSELDATPRQMDLDVAELLASLAVLVGEDRAASAATIEGLIGTGISSGSAVSAVLVYRSATYWLPVLPGWYSWRLPERWGYL